MFSSRSYAAFRLLVGLLQGGALYFLYSALDAKRWPAADGMVFAPLLLIALFVPVILLMGAGTIRARALAVSAVVASLGLTALALHDKLRAGPLDRGLVQSWADSDATFPSAVLCLCVAGIVFVIQALVAAAQSDRQAIASYPAYFDAAWKQAVQIVFSAAFVGAFWAVLWLGVGLFELIKLSFLRELIEHPWFAIPITALAFACAIHVTDIRAGIVRGIRTLVLVLLSWLLPLLTLFVMGFLACLPVVGVDLLWRTGHASALLLFGASVLIVLINTAYQDGTPEHAPPGILRFAGRVAAVALTPIVALAAYALFLRVQQYGWTANLVLRAAFNLVLAAYALTYLAAAFSRGPWLRRLELGNIALAGFTVLVALALLSPVADPMRIAVASQVGRLEARSVAPDKFDYDYLRFRSGKYGLAALEGLKAGAPDDKVRSAVEQALARTSPIFQPRSPKPADLAQTLTVRPAGTVLPESFLRQSWTSSDWTLPACLKQSQVHCDAYLLDLDGDGTPEVLLVNSRAFAGGPKSGSAIELVPATPIAVSGSVMKVDAQGNWSVIGKLSGQWNCSGVTDALAAGRIQVRPPAIPDFDIAGLRFTFTREVDSARPPCP